MLTNKGIKEATELLTRYSQKYHPPGKKRKFLTMHFAHYISEDLISEARALYAFYNPEEETPLFLFREASHEIYGAGLLVTTKAIYYCLSFSNMYGPCFNAYLLDDVTSFELKQEGLFKGTKI